MLRHLLSIILLPFVVVVVVPAWLLHVSAADDTNWANAALLAWLLRAIRFGERYRVYKANVPRWIPRLKSWRDE